VLGFSPTKATAGDFNQSVVAKHLSNSTKSKQLSSNHRINIQHNHRLEFQIHWIISEFSVVVCGNQHSGREKVRECFDSMIMSVWTDKVDKVCLF
jgi:hypothetical protein